MATTISRSDRVTTRRRLRALLLGTAILSVGPVGVGAQATSLGASPAREVPPTTHTVKRGDTLWDIAARYLANPFRWPEISGRNTTLIQDPDLIEPGWVLVIAGEPLSAAGAGRPMPRATDVDSAAAGARGASQGVPPMAATPPRVIGGDPASRWAARRREAERVPYLVGLGGIEGAGWIVLPQARNVSGMPATAPGLVQLYDRVRLVLPKGSAVAPGMTLLTLRSGPTLKGIGRVAIPTGLLRVISDSAGGIAELVTMFDQGRRRGAARRRSGHARSAGSARERSGLDARAGRHRRRAGGAGDTRRGQRRAPESGGWGDRRRDDGPSHRATPMSAPAPRGRGPIFEG